jgi:hypothetical protein
MARKIMFKAKVVQCFMVESGYPDIATIGIVERRFIAAGMTPIRLNLRSHMFHTVARAFFTGQAPNNRLLAFIHWV